MSTVQEIIEGGEPLQIAILEGEPYQRQRITLDGRAFTLYLAWNQWAQSWTFSLYDSEESPIVQGVRIVVNLPLLRYYKHDPRTPQGELIAQDLTNENRDPGFDEFGIGKRVELIYFAQT